ncbi:MAG TPA: glycosyltransferase family 2 protein [Burkholderiaceae bacterium]|nr:glycosyltransferase family 2 protein [Burkholderiaceae bacterium]
MPVPSKVSIALCTFNGERFVREQLESIWRQTRLPDEIVAVDDASADGTWAVLARCAAESPVPIRLMRNPQRLGYAQNFERAISLCAGEIVFLCDQDDVWMPEKIALMCVPFERDTSVMLVHSDALLVNAELKPLGVRLFRALGLTSAERAEEDSGNAFALLLKRNIVTGATCAIRREVYAHATPFDPNFVHDEWLALHAALRGRLVRLEQPLIRYRQHQANQIGAPPLGSVARTRRLLAGRVVSRKQQEVRLTALLRRLHRMKPAQASATVAVSKALGLVHVRAALPGIRLLRLPVIAYLLLSGQYSSHARGLHTAIRDMLEPDRTSG